MPSAKTKKDTASHKLVIVESPTKAKTISKFLGADFDVEASFGHIRDLPANKLNIDVKNNFEPTYEIPAKAKEHVALLRKKAKESSEVILATDEDREGEAIAWHLAHALKLDPQSTKRIVFHEITKSAIEEALASPRTIDTKLVDAQQARRVLDRLVGYELSPFLWRKIRYGLSAGRVQSVAVRLVVERERAIEGFDRKEYWTIEAQFENDARKKFSAKLSAIEGKNLGKMDLGSSSQCEQIISSLKGASYRISKITLKEASRSPAPPFITSTLQQEAARKLGFSARQTMTIAQHLYEKGLITYMRTDSVNLAKSAVDACRGLIASRFGDAYVPKEPRIYTARAKGAQEAHEAIRPTDIAHTPEDSPIADRGEKKLYELIWKRTIACQMENAKFNQTAADIESSKGSATFRATGQVVLFEGFLKAYLEGRDEDEAENEDEDSTLPALAEGESVKEKQIEAKQHFTEPPARYTDATLVKALESEGIGRPSTYAPTLTTVQERGYVEKEDKKYKPTEIGILVNDLLVANFPEIVDYKFTSHVEEELDSVAEGRSPWTQICREFYDPFKKHLEEKEKTVEKIVEVSDVPCPHCAKPMLIKFGRMGKFLACPEEGSKVTLPMPEEAAKIKELTEKTRDEKCPLCGSAMAVKRGRFGFFLGCTAYPKCKGMAKIWNKTGFKCPNCKTGDVAEKKARGRGKPFWGCTRYPDCTFVMNVRPENETQLQEAFAAWKANPPKAKPKKTVTKKTR